MKDDFHAAAGKDPAVERMQAALRMAGFAEVDVDGQKKDMAADGIRGPITNAAMKAYAKANGMKDDASVSDINKNIEERLKANPHVFDNRMDQVMQQGQNAPAGDIKGMQVLLNLLSQVIQVFTGRPLNVDGILGVQTASAFAQYSKTEAAAPAPAKPAAIQAPATLPVEEIHSTPVATVVIPDPPAATQTATAPAATAQSYQPPAQPAVNQPAANQPIVVAQAAQPQQYVVGQGGTLNGTYNAEAARMAPPAYDYARPMSRMDMIMQEREMQRERMMAERDMQRERMYARQDGLMTHREQQQGYDQISRGLGGLTDRSKYNDGNAAGQVLNGVLKIFDPAGQRTPGGPRF